MIFSRTILLIASVAIFAHGSTASPHFRGRWLTVCAGDHPVCYATSDTTCSGATKAPNHATKPPTCDSGYDLKCAHNCQKPPRGGTGGTGTGSGTGGGTSGGTTCTTLPCPASLLGTVAKTTVSGTDVRTGNTLPVGEDIYGPFEAGFSSQQDSILEGLGCSSGSLGHVAGGIDTHVAEQMVAKQCNVVLPRVENAGANGYISLLDECGGHTREYHFHERLSCLYNHTAGSGHSPKIGEASDPNTTPMYGKWEDFSANTLPTLDACGGHFGQTPDSGGLKVYHYHVQANPPFTIGCYGPDKDASGTAVPVSLDKCRSLYEDCGSGILTVSTPTKQNFRYDDWCPCYDPNNEYSNYYADNGSGGAGSSSTGAISLAYIGIGAGAVVLVVILPGIFLATDIFVAK